MANYSKIRHLRHLRRVRRIQKPLREPLKLAPSPWIWATSVHIGIATTLPLALGIFHHQPQLALIGSIAGFLMVLNDPAGRLGYRLSVYLTTAASLALGFLLGRATHGHPAVFYAGTVAMSYWIALMGTQGAELERAALFALFHYLAGHYLDIPMQALPLLAIYGGLALVISCGLCLALRRPTPPPSPRLPELFRQSLTRGPRAHRYAASFVLTLLASLLFIEVTKFERGYWIAGTVLLLIRPDSVQSLHRIYQRFFGTFVGLMIAIALIFALHSPWALLVFISLCSFFTPWALVTNHWLGTVFITVMISLMFDLMDPARGDFHTPWLRFVATCIACLFALVPLTVSWIFHARGRNEARANCPH